MLCAALVAIPVAGLTRARSHPTRTNVTASAAALAPAPTVADDHAAVDRASRSSDAWARQAIEEAPVDDTSTTAAPTTTTRRRSVVTTTTTRPKPAVTTTTRPKAPPATAAPRKAAPAPPPTNPDNSQNGKASYYDAAPAGTCAHRTLPMGTIVTVTATASGKSITCKVSDRGPFAGGFIIDLAKSDFAQLAPVSQGVVEVRLTW